ncbi:hypothetical protein BVX97_02185 [bacterium E08(2017)]|nr:hypothetical protein BVX97_02185 [bacterium E08(2017)]
MFKSSYKLATIWGIPIRANISMFILLIFIAWELSSFAGAWAVPFALLLGFLLFSSIALHELGHSFVALKKGCKVKGITLALIGGVASMESVPDKPKDEFQMAIAGPLVSLSLAGIAYGLRFAIYSETNEFRYMAAYFFEVIGFLNLLLGCFNLIPAFPMDGGRVLRALLTPKKGRLKATYIAARIGKVLAILFGIYGLHEFFLEKETYGIFKVAIALFVYSGADNEYKLVYMQEMGDWLQDDEPQ